MKRTSLILASAAFTALAIVGCGDSGTEPTPPKVEEKASYEVLQTEILTKSCALSGCHAGTTPAAGLSMEASVAYQNLINVQPTTTAAKNDGHMRVRPGKPDSSLLYLKVAGHLKAGYGERMPLGSAALDSGRIEFIRQWIAAGAPKTGKVADTALLSIVSTEEYVPLQAPAPGEGIQINLKPFEISPRSEREIFYRTTSANNEQIFVKKFHVRMRNNSHHFILYTYPEDAPILPPEGEIRDQGGDMEQYTYFRQFFAGSQVNDFIYEFPAGVALPLNAKTPVDLNSHYVNPGDKPVDGQVQVNLYTTSQPQRYAEAFLSGPTDFQIAPFSTQTVQYIRTVDVDTDIFMLTSHMHKRGKTFRIYVVGGANNGQLVYESNDWHLPPVKTFPQPLRLNAGEGLRIVATYQNNSEYMVRFGLTSEDEMCFMAGYMAPV